MYTTLAHRLVEDGCAVCHFTWKTPPIRPGARGLLKMPKTLRDGTADVAAAVRCLRVAHEEDSMYYSLPLVIVGYCFGVPAALAAVANSLRREAATPSLRKGSPEAVALGPLAGILGISSAMRADTAENDYHGCDTITCIQDLAPVGVPLLLMHGLDDSVVDVNSVAMLFDAIPGPKAAAWMIAGDHSLMSRFDVAVEAAYAWVVGLIRRYEVAGGIVRQLAPPKEAESGIPFGRMVTM